MLALGRRQQEGEDGCGDRQVGEQCVLLEGLCLDDGEGAGGEGGGREGEEGGQREGR